MRAMVGLGVLAGILLSGFSQGAEGKTLRFRLPAEPVTLDWNVARSSAETYILMNVMEGLVEEGDDMVVKPALASSWTVSPDGLTYTFTLRKGVKWSDGQGLTARHFTESWSRLAAKSTRSPYQSFLSDIQSASAVSDSELKVVLRRPSATFLHRLTFWAAFPRHGKATLGPYFVKEWKKKKVIHLEKNPQWQGGVLGFDRIEAVIEPSDKKAREMFARGELDLLLEATTADLIAIKPGARVERFNYLATYYLGFKSTGGPTQDPLVRKAFALALDREALVLALSGGQTVTQRWVPPGMEGHRTGVGLEGSLYDARGALAQAGFAEGERFPKLTLGVQKFDGAEKVAELLIRQFKERLGVGLSARVMTPAEYQKAQSRGGVDLFVAHWGADYPEASNFLEVFLSGAPTNPGKWSNLAYDTLMERARVTVDRDERLRLYAEAEDLLLRREVVIAPLFNRKNAVLVGPAVKKLGISPLNYIFFKNWE